MRLIILYDTSINDNVIGAYINNDVPIQSNIAPEIAANSTVRMMYVTLLAGNKVALNSGSVDVNYFLKYVTRFRRYDNTRMQIQSMYSLSSTDKRKIEEADIDNTVPMSFARANTIVNLGRL